MDIRRSVAGLRRAGLRRTGGAAIAATAVLSALAVPAYVGGPPAAAATCSDSWPMFQHDASRHGSPTCSAITATNVATLHPAWYVSTPQPVTASPVVVDNQVYVGDAAGTFYDINATTGAVNWTFQVLQPSYNCASGIVAGDQHQVSYGEITGSAAVSTLPSGTPVVYFGGGGTVFALNANPSPTNGGGSCLWAVNADPAHPTSNIEVESSPVVVPNGSGGAHAVIVGSDSNEGPGSSAPPGVQALEASSGLLLWKFEPENNTTDSTESDSSVTNGCGDVWSSPSYDPNAVGGHGMVVATTGNCPIGSTNPGAAAAPVLCPMTQPPPNMEGIVGLDATTGCLVWRWTEPVNQYANPSFPDGGDTDIGASPILTTVGGVKAVVDGSKSGYMYAVSEQYGTTMWSNQIAEPGETGPAFAGAIGGFIGSSSLGVDSGLPTVFGSTAIPSPFNGNGIPSSPTDVQGSLDTGLICVNLPTGAHCDPERIASLHAVDVATGAVKWHALTELPTYGAVTTTNNVVFAPSTTGFDLDAYDADNGVLVWKAALDASMSSAVAITGNSIFFGAGTDGLPIPVSGEVPPQLNGIWSFTESTTQGIPPSLSLVGLIGELEAIVSSIVAALP